MSGYRIAMATGAALMCGTAAAVLVLALTVLTDPVGLATSAAGGNLADVMTTMIERALAQLW